MNAASLARQSELDQALDAQQPSAALAEELFAVADALAAQPGLRNALADPTAPDSARRALAGAVLTGRVSQAAVALAQAAAALRWSSAADLGAAIERQGVRAELALAQASGSLDLVEDELFRFGRVVDADNELRGVLGDRSAPLADRQQVVSDLLAGRVHPVTLSLARRAVTASARTYDLTLGAYLNLAAAARSRAIAHVVVARPLEPDQADRLRAVLSRQVGRDVGLQVVVDPEVVGGARVRIGDEVIDGTVAGKLEAASRQLS